MREGVVWSMVARRLRAKAQRKTAKTQRVPNRDATQRGPSVQAILGWVSGRNGGWGIGVGCWGGSRRRLCGSVPLRALGFCDLARGLRHSFRSDPSFIPQQAADQRGANAN